MQYYALSSAMAVTDVHARLLPFMKTKLRALSDALTSNLLILCLKRWFQTAGEIVPPGLRHSEPVPAERRRFIQPATKAAIYNGSH